MVTFGEYVRNLRLQKRLTLRDFCRQTELDPSNWSKIERGLLLPPRSRVILGRIANTLGLDDGSEEWLTIADLAVVAHVPIELLDDRMIVDSLPVFFRTMRGQKPTTEELENLIRMIRQA